MSFRIVAYVTLALLVLLALNSLTDRVEGINEQRERQSVADARRWHKGFVQIADSAKRATVVAQNAVAKSKALRDSVRVVNDTTILADTVVVHVPQIVVRRLVADSVSIARLSIAIAISDSALIIAKTSIAAYEKALVLAQQNQKCRILGVIPCPSRRATMLLTGGVLIAAKVALGGTL